MAWKAPFSVFRIVPPGKLQEVFNSWDLKKAKYWLSYIAEPGDVLCKNPCHPKHSGKGPSPEYWSHKESSGKIITNENIWLDLAKGKHCELKFPEEHQIPVV
jgi:hypothetical protein